MAISFFPFYRREARMPSKHSRVCSCHFREGKKSNGPEMFERNKDKLFTEQRGSPPKKKKIVPTEKTLAELVEQAQINKPSSFEKENKQRPKTTEEVILETELDQAKIVLKNLEDTLHYKNKVLHCD